MQYHILIFLWFLVLLPLTSAASADKRYKHSEYETPSPVITSNVDEKITEKPEFTDCSEYAPKIKENSELYTDVIQVHAKVFNETDDDCIVYELIPSAYYFEKPKFLIDRVTGHIRTNYRFDRESANEDEQTIKVHAIDNCNRGERGICSFNVTIEDVNDEEPLFNELMYFMTASKELVIGSKIGQVLARDNDEGINAKLSYSIRVGNTQLRNDTGYFTINETTGEIFLAKVIDKEFGYIFHYTVIATDHGEKPLYATVEVKIVITEKVFPSFVRITPNDTIRIRENFKDTKNPIMRIEAVSNLNDSRPVYLEIVGLCRDKKSKNLVKIVPWIVKSHLESVDVELSNPDGLDAEKHENCKLFIKTGYENERYALMTVAIEIIDVNDEHPVFVLVGSVNIPENRFPENVMMRVRAIDRDVSNEFNQVTYAIENHQNLFSIDNETGVIKLLTPLDRETQDYYELSIIATEKAHNHMGKLNNATQTLKIYVQDLNDNPPIFNQTIYIADSISRKLNKMDPVITVNATDKDKDTHAIKYKILSGNLNGNFHIDETSGEIRINLSPHYKISPKYNLTVRASDGKFHDDATVLISIRNSTSSDEERRLHPVITDSSANSTDYVGLVPKNLPINSNVVKISIWDISQNDSLKRFSIISVPPEDGDYFKINESTGMITLNKTIDKEPGYSFRLIVETKYEEEEYHIGILVRVREYNYRDGCFFIRKIPSGQIQIAENFELNRPFARFQALSSITDEPDVIFRLNSTDKTKVFRLQPSGKSEAIIELKEVLDYETITHHKISARSRYTQDTVSMDIDIEILDLNDDSPRFPSHYYDIELPRNKPRGTFVMQVQATDNDRNPEYNSVFYELENFNDLFTINETTGVIKTLKTFNRNVGQTYSLKIYAGESIPNIYYISNEKRGGDVTFVAVKII